VLHVDDLIETGAEKVVLTRMAVLFRSHPILQSEAFSESQTAPKMNPKSQENDTQNAVLLQFLLLQIAKKPLNFNRERVFHRELNSRLLRSGFER
jgi:hypothetical protein